ncbi:MAG: hypothetical protein KIT31_39670 [Deltaproteobacteria bacterium]|nr:hypothetical protein [Deltaproteobacteria bacterium]
MTRVSEPTRWSDICRCFPAQWVVLVALDWTDDDGREVRTAFVAGTSAVRTEALAVARPLLAVFEPLGAFHTSSSRVPSLPPIFHIAENALPSPSPSPSPFTLAPHPQPS